MFIDLFDTRIEQKEEIVIIYDSVNFELVRLRKLKVTFISVAIRALGIVTGRIEAWIKNIGIDC